MRALKAQIREEADVINRAKLLSELEREEAGQVPDVSGLEAVFVAEAKAWSDDTGVTVGALQTLGVSDDVLRTAGFEISTPGPTRAARSRSRDGGTRAPRLPIGDVAAAARQLGATWRLADLANQIGREPATTRNYLKQLVADGTVVEVGDDPKHDGRGRAPKIYAIS